MVISIFLLLNIWYIKFCTHLLVALSRTPVVWASPPQLSTPVHVVALLKHAHPVIIPSSDLGSLCGEGEQRKLVAFPAVFCGFGLVCEG